MSSAAIRKPAPRRQIFLLIALIATSWLLAGCVKLQQKIVVHASPETVAPEIANARWPQTSIPVHYCLDPDNGFENGDVVLALLAKAFSAWGVPTQSDGICNSPVSNDDARNEVSWAPLSQPGSEISEAGKTSLRYRIPPGGAAQIVEADIEIDNNAPDERRNQDCLYTTILHETGHFLGLHHLQGGTVMAPIVTECLQDLTPSDRQALSALY